MRTVTFIYFLPLDAPVQTRTKPPTDSDPTISIARSASLPDRSAPPPRAMADEAKAKGNAAFSAGRFEEAAAHFTDAIALAPDNHVLYSNRSAAYASLHRYPEALADAERTVALRPDWARVTPPRRRAPRPRRRRGRRGGLREGLALEPSNGAL